MKSNLHQFPGGLLLDGHKTESLQRGLHQANLPEQLILPLKQHIGEINQPLVKMGDRVSRGQVIASGASLICASLHAPTSGTISAIDYRPVAHPSGQSDLCIVIDVDGDDTATDIRIDDPEKLDAGELVERIGAAGIVGLGGAAFPTSPKLSRGKLQRVDTLIINGVECEPYITCDDTLMQHYANEVVRGIGYLQTMLEPKETLIAIEDNKPEALALVKGALRNQSLEHTQLIAIPARYPAGGEKQLVQILTGLEVPQGKLAFDLGVYCQNVGTCVAITRALEQGEPLISRIVTVAGDDIREPGNWEVRLGTPIAHLVKLAGGYHSSTSHLVMGGPMMGFSLSGDRVPIVKASNCILAMRHETVPRQRGLHDECVRCGKCNEVCPAGLLPQQLYWHARAKAYERAQEYKLFDCIECGCCSVVCPSQIPLVQYYRAGKSEIRATQKAQYKSDRARTRFEFREKRLALKKQQEEERRRLKREALQKKRATTTAASEEPDPVQAALERVKARKQATLEDQS